MTKKFYFLIPSLIVTPIVFMSCVNNKESKPTVPTPPEPKPEPVNGSDNKTTPKPKTETKSEQTRQKRELKSEEPKEPSASDEEIKKIKNILDFLSFTVKPKSDLSKILPSKATNEQLKDIEFHFRTSEYRLPQSYKMTYKFYNEKLHNDSAGASLVEVTLSNGKESYTVRRDVYGFQTVLGNITSVVPTFSTDKSKVKASEAVDGKGLLDRSKVQLTLLPYNLNNLDNYYLEFFNVKSDDTLGELSFDIKISLKSDSQNIHKTFKDIKIEGFKKE